MRRKFGISTKVAGGVLAVAMLGALNATTAGAAGAQPDGATSMGTHA